MPELKRPVRKELGLDRYDVNRLLVENSLGLLCVHDLEGRLVWVNPAVCEVLGYSAEELVGMDLRDLLAPSVRDRFPRYIERMLSEGRHRGLMKILTKDGEELYWTYRNVLFDRSGEAFVLGHALDVTDRAEIAAALRASEKRYRSLVEHSAEGIYRVEFVHPFSIDRPEEEQIRQIFTEGFMADCNDVHARNYGFQSREEMIGRPIAQFLPREDPFNLEAVQDWIRQGYRRIDVETRQIDIDGQHRRFLANAIGVLDDRTLEYVWGTARDITALTSAHSTIRNLVGELLTAQESERRRISRDLHDVLNQRLAVLAIEIGALRQRLETETGQAPNGLGELQGQVEDLSFLVRELSHQLHPATLEHLGLVATLRSYCNEFSKREAIRVRLDVDDAPERLPSEAAVCLYRVAQESLRNVAKHSRGEVAELSLRELDDVVQLTITDRGVGFDVESVKLKGGLGLVSIEERVRLLDGAVAIESELGRGTRIEARLPR